MYIVVCLNMPFQVYNTFLALRTTLFLHTRSSMHATYVQPQIMVAVGWIVTVRTKLVLAFSVMDCFDVCFQHKYVYAMILTEIVQKKNELHKY